MRYYMDTSALVKRYITEPGSDYIDNVFGTALGGVDTILISYWNVGEAATVLDKTERKFKSIDALKSLTLMLEEFESLSGMQSLEFEDVWPSLIRSSINIVLRHHVYISDALQVATAKKGNADIFLSGDRKLVEIASKEGLKAVYIPEERTATKS